MRFSALLSAIAILALICTAIALVLFPSPPIGFVVVGKTQQQEEKIAEEQLTGLTVLPQEKECRDFADFEFLSLQANAGGNEAEFSFKNKLDKKLLLHAVSFGRSFSPLEIAAEGGFPIEIAPFAEFSIQVNGSIDRTQQGLIAFAYLEENSTIYNLDETTCFS